MAYIISRTEEINKKLESENNGQVLNSASDIKKINEINKHMTEVRRDFQVKERESQNAAANVILTS